MKNESKLQIELEIYKRYRTLYSGSVPMTDSELQKYQTPERIQNTLDKDYAEILFGEDDEDDWKGKITKIVVSDSIPAESVIRSSVTTVYGDISEAGDGSVIGWIEKLEAAVSEDGTEYILHIDGNGKVYAPADSTELFSWFSNVKEIEFDNAFDTSYVVSMRAMFWFCEELSILDVSGFNTENVTEMCRMFCFCKHLQKVDVSSFNTEKVTDMNGMFGDCYRLQELDVSSFRTKNVTDMNGMFRRCRSLKRLDLSSFTIPYDKALKRVLEVFVCEGCFRLQEVIVQLDGKRQSLNLDLKPEKNVLNKDYKTILFGEDGKKEWERTITKIIFSASMPEGDVIESSGTSIYGNISEEKDESIIGWVEKNDAEYILHIDGNGKVYALEDCKGLFADFSQAETIEFGDVFDTSRAVIWRICSAIAETCLH